MIIIYFLLKQNKLSFYIGKINNIYKNIRIKKRDIFNNLYLSLKYNKKN